MLGQIVQRHGPTRKRDNIPVDRKATNGASSVDRDITDLALLEEEKVRATEVGRDARQTIPADRNCNPAFRRVALERSGHLEGGESVPGAIWVLYSEFLADTTCNQYFAGARRRGGEVEARLAGLARPRGRLGKEHGECREGDGDA